MKFYPTSKKSVVTILPGNRPEELDTMSRNVSLSFFLRHRMDTQILEEEEEFYNGIKMRHCQILCHATVKESLKRNKFSIPVAVSLHLCLTLYWFKIRIVYLYWIVYFPFGSYIVNF